jgi:ankyrin repeat protein
VSEAARLLNDKPTMVHKRGLYMRTPLLCASSRGHLPVVKLLVEEGAALDDTDEIKWSALHHAAANGHAAVIHYLADEGEEGTGGWKSTFGHPDCRGLSHAGVAVSMPCR